MFRPTHYEPLPGTRPAPRGLFLDRWGTLLERTSSPVSKFEDLEFATGSIDLLFRAQQMGWSIYLIGNEDDVSHGRVTHDDYRGVQEQLVAHLEAHGVTVHRDYTCVDDPLDGIEGRRADSVYRLPNTGAFYHALHNDAIELSDSWVVGDSTVELVAGWRAGCMTLGLQCGEGLADRTFHVEPDLVANTLAEGLEGLLRATSLLH